MMPRKSNIQQSEPQREELNVHANLHVSAIRYAACGFKSQAVYSMTQCHYRYSAMHIQYSWHRTKKINYLRFLQ